MRKSTSLFTQLLSGVLIRMLKKDTPIGETIHGQLKRIRNEPNRKWISTLVALALLLSGIVASPANFLPITRALPAAPTTTILDQESPYDESAAFNGYSQYVHWQQEVRTDIAGTLLGFDLYVTTPGTTIVYVNTGFPWQTDANEFEASFAPTTNGWFFVDTSSAGITLVQNQTFVIGIHGTNEGGLWLGGSAPGQYSRGELYESGIPFIEPNYRDIAFRTYMESDQVPADPTPPALSIPDDLIPDIAGTVSAPVNFTGGGNDIVSTAFTIGFDTTCLSYVGATLDNDLTTDGYVLNIEDSWVVAGNVRYVIQPPLNETLPAFGDGSLLNLDFMVAPGPCSTTPTEILLMDASFGNSAGASVVGTTSDGSVILNRPPVAEDDTATTNEDTSIVIDLLANDGDPDVVSGDTISLWSVNASTQGYLWVSGTSTVDYSPNGQFDYLAPGQSADDTFSYTIADNYGEQDSANVIVTVTGVNDNPIGAEDTFVTDEDSPITVDVILNDTDVDDGDVLSLGSFNTVTAIGSVTSSGNQITYDPNGKFQGLGVGEEGIDIFDYTVNDSFGGSDTVAIAVRIYGANDNPVADDDLAVTAPGAPVDVNVLDGDTDPDSSDWLTLSSVSTPAHGVASMNSPWVTYTPNANFQGVEQFTYQVADNHAGLGTGTVRVVVGNRGDCNSDSVTDAGDLPAIVLEYFDGDANDNWLDVVNGSFTNGNPLGCDTNQDFAIGAGDLSCEARILLANDNTLSCSGLRTAVNAAPARLSLGGSSRAAEKESVSVTLDTQGHAIAAAVFSLDLPDGLAFNPDRDLAFTLPDGIQSLVLYDATDPTGELDLVVYSLSLQPLSDGALATISVPGGTVRFSSAVPASLGSVDGTTVSVVAENRMQFIFLPQIAR